MTTGPPSDFPHLILASASEDWRVRVREALASASYRVTAVGTAKEVLEALESRAGPCLVLIDAQLEDATGLAVCRQIRERDGVERTPILFVSRFAAEMDRVLCFESGADDFLADPFFGRELLSRVQAVMRRDLRRGQTSREPPETRFGDVAVDLRRGRVEVSGRPVPLTARELDVLRTLILHNGRVVRREDLLDSLEGGDARTARVVDTHVKAIRRKLGSARGHIQTVRGVGYRFSSDG